MLRVYLIWSHIAPLVLAVMMMMMGATCHPNF